MSEYDVIVIGAGQAGLAAAHALRSTDLGFTVLQPGDQGRYPHRDEAAAYLRQNAELFPLPVRTGSRFTAVRTRPDGFDVEVSDGEQLTARAVIAITGPCSASQVPALPGLADHTGELLHASAYRRPDAAHVVRQLPQLTSARLPGATVPVARRHG